MKEYAEGNITELPAKDGTIVYNILVPAVICLPSTKTCVPIEFLIDTGADKSMISYKDGIELGLEAPGTKEKSGKAYDANGNEVPFVKRKIDLLLGTINKKGIEICWCTRPRIGKNFLGMDFFKDYKLIVQSKNMKSYIIKNSKCIRCYR